MEFNKFKHKLLFAAVMATLSPIAYSQSSEGAIFGLAKSNETVTVKNIENGAIRQIKVPLDGRFHITKLQPGTYEITVNGQTRNVEVNMGTTAEINFSEVQQVQVAGRKVAIDVKSVESTKIFTINELQALPVSRDINSVALLTPGTVASNSSGFNGIPSFSGASSAENAFFINGFDTTNSRKFLNYVSIPFDAIGQQEVKAGGYGAEFGRSLGGVVSTTTRRGGNEWKGGVALYLNPQFLRASTKDILSLDPDAKLPGGAPGYVAFNSANKSNSMTYNLYAGGPLIKDKLFIFALLEGRNNTSDSYGSTTSSIASNESPNGVIRLDWQINDAHRLELTRIDNRQRSTTKIFNNPSDSKFPNDAAKNPRYLPYHYGPVAQTQQEDWGGTTTIGKYVGHLTDNLSVSATVGEIFYLNSIVQSDLPIDMSCPPIYGTNGLPEKGCWTGSSSYGFTIPDPNVAPAHDKKKGQRLDLEYIWGNHTIRAGFDNINFVSTTRGTNYPTGSYYRYYTTSNGTVNGVKNAVAAGGQYVRLRKISGSSGAFEVSNDAKYIEDSWNITPQIMLYGGLRWESFENLNSDGVAIASKKNMMAPRLGAAWDVNGDASLKVYGSAGRYYIPIAANTNIRSSVAGQTIDRFYPFNGRDPRTLAPLNLGAEIGTAQITGTERAPIPETIVDANLKPMSQDEFVLGFEKAFEKNLIIGVKYVNRKVKSGMDDFCGRGQINKWAKDNGYSKFNFNSLAECILINPGEDINLKMDLNNDGKLSLVTIPNSAIGLPKYERNYDALEVSFSKRNGDNWTLGGSYTYSKARGNAEGYVQSDLGQTDSGITQDFDFTSLTHGANGVLPTNRTHSLKLHGTYKPTDRTSVGVNFSLASGRSYSCIGFVPSTVSDFYGVGTSRSGGAGAWTSASSYYCLNDKFISELHPRGSAGTTPWTHSLNMNFGYTLPLSGKQSIQFQIDVFNVFNKREVLMVNQVRDYSRETSLIPGDGKLNPNYMRPNSFQGGRSARITARYEF